MKETEIYITKKGLEELKQELNELVNIKRPKILNEIKTTRDLGDLSENAGYHAAKEQQTFMESRINQIEEIIKNAVVKDENKGGKIDIGSNVTLQSEGKTHNYSIVGSSESNPVEGKISYQSPIGSVLMGKKQGDSIKVETPMGITNYKIVKVS